MPEFTFPIDRKDLIEGLGKGLRVIECFDDLHPRLTPSEVGAKAGISRTAARRYLLSLCHFGYAGTDGKQFWLMPKVLRLGHSYLSAARLPRLLQPFIQRISMTIGETVNFSVLDGHEVVYLARSNAPRVVSIGFHPGARAPAHTVTAGVVLLSTLPDDRLHQWIEEHDFAGYTPNTITSRKRFLKEVMQARAAGYWVTEGQLDVGLRGIALPLRDLRGDCKGAIGATLQMQPLTREQTIERMLPVLRETVEGLRSIV